MSYRAQRSYHEDKTAGYFLPSDSSEIERLDNQHLAIRKMFGGKFCVFAPVKWDGAASSPIKVLDSGTGTGAWIADIADQYPHVLFHGVDLVTDNFYSPHPPNVSASALNLLADEVPLAHSSFQLINQRLLLAAFTPDNWTKVLCLYHKLLTPGSWVQLGEFDFRVSADFRGEIPSSGISRLLTWMRAIAAQRSIDIDSARTLNLMLQKAGFVNVQEEQGTINTKDSLPPPATITASEWLVDSLRAVSIRAVDLGWTSTEDYEAVIQKARSETEAGVNMYMRYVWAQKPMEM